MDWIDFLAAIQKMDKTVIGKGQENGQSRRLPSVLGDAFIISDPERELDRDVEHDGDRRENSP